MALDPGRRLAPAASGSAAAAAAAAAAVTLALLGGGCGGASKPAPATATASTTSTTASTASRTRAHHRARRRPTAIRTSRSSTTTSAGVSTAPPPPSPGIPAAPDGLRQTIGYSTYELCAGACRGSVPSGLRRPLHLPHGCTSTGPASPVAPEGPADVKLSPFVGSAWRGARVTWTASRVYVGPVLIRGRRIDGSGAVGFGEGRTPYDELQLLAPGQGAPPPPGGGRAWLSFTRVRTPGCYAYQLDGTSFSRVIAFRAR